MSPRLTRRFCLNSISTSICLDNVELKDNQTEFSQYCSLLPKQLGEALRRDINIDTVLLQKTIHGNPRT